MMIFKPGRAKKKTEKRDSLCLPNYFNHIIAHTYKLLVEDTEGRNGGGVLKGLGILGRERGGVKDYKHPPTINAKIQ